MAIAAEYGEITGLIGALLARFIRGGPSHVRPRGSEEV